MTRLGVINYCRECGLILLSFPPHTSHRLQPLDVAVYGPFKKFYNAAADSWMKNNPGGTMVIYNIPTLVRTSLLNAATPKNILAGFKSTGIWPYNRQVFSDKDYLPSAVTDRPLIDVENPTVCDRSGQAEHELGENQVKVLVTEKSPGEDFPTPSTSKTENAPISSPTNIHITPQELRPYPKASERKKVTKRRKIKSAVLTSSPMKKNNPGRRRSQEE